MATIRDLDECRYFGQRDERLVAVGWLGKDAPYPRGDVDRTFFAKLEELCEAPWEPFHYSGWHCCEFCPPPPAPPRPTSALKRFFSPFRAPPLVSFEAFSCNLFVPYKNRVFASPEGIVHYISTHGYRPPDIYFEAVLACPPMSSIEYFAALRENGGPLILSALPHDHGAA